MPDWYFDIVKIKKLDKTIEDKSNIKSLRGINSDEK